MKKRMIYFIMMTMVAGTLFTGCKDKDDAPVQNSSVVEEADPSSEDTVEEPEEKTDTDGEPAEEPETGNFQELNITDNMELEVEEGQVSTGA